MHLRDLGRPFLTVFEWMWRAEAWETCNSLGFIGWNNWVDGGGSLGDGEVEEMWFSGWRR